MNSSNVAGGVKIGDLANTGQIVKRTEAVDEPDDLQLDKAVYLHVTSSKEEEVPEDKESSNVSSAVFLLQAEVMGDDGIAEHNDNIHKEGDHPESEITVSRKRPLVETEAGATSENSERQKLSRPPRYFDPPDCSLPAFKPCKIIYGNMKRKRRKKRKPCYICARSGHHGKSCPQVNCSICSKKENENDAEEYNTAIFCLKCGSSGHDMFSCRNDYNPEDLKNIQCYICKDFGHLCCAGNIIEGASQASCYKCGESGHYGFECTKLNEVANHHQSVSLCSKCKRRVHSQQNWKLDNKATSAETVVEKDAVAVKPVKAVVEKDAVAVKPVKAKSRKSRRRGRKKKPMPTTIATQSGPNMSMRDYRMPTLGQYYWKPVSNIWLSPAAAAARNSLNNPAALNQSSYQHKRPSANYQAGGLPHQNFFNPGSIFPPAFYSQHLNHQTGAHLSHHTIKHQVGIQVPPNSFDPRGLPPVKFYQGTQIPGQLQNKVQLPYQNISHQVGTQVPHSVSDSQTQIQPVNQILSHQTGAQLSHHTISHQVGIQVPPNSFDPGALPPAKFYQGTQIPGQLQNKVQLPYQNISHQVGTQVPQSTSDSQTQIQPVNQILSHQTGAHLSHHTINHQVGIQVPPNSFDPRDLPPAKFYQGTQIPGHLQNKVQLPYQNISHPVGTQVPQSISDSQTQIQPVNQILSHQTGAHLSHHTINHQVGIQVPPNSFDPRALPPAKFYQGSQIPGQLQNKVQLPYQNISHQVGTQVPQSTSDSQTQIPKPSNKRS